MCDDYAQLPVHRSPEPDERLVGLLRGLAPTYREVLPDAVRATLEALLGVRVRYQSRGPCATDVTDYL